MACGILLLNRQTPCISSLSMYYIHQHSKLSLWTCKAWYLVTLIYIDVISRFFIVPLSTPRLTLPDVLCNPFFSLTHLRCISHLNLHSCTLAVCSFSCLSSLAVHAPYLSPFIPFTGSAPRALLTLASVLAFDFCFRVDKHFLCTC